MATELFDVEEHTLPAQHIRGYHNALKTQQEDVLHLAIKAYRPKAPPNIPLKHPAITIIAGHANGFPKETYEPLWDDLLKEARAQGFDIRSIWFADNAHQGESGVLNQTKLGDDPAWFDHSRDLLHMINHFRGEFIRPIIGIAHSMGCAQLAHLSVLHPRLLSGLILCEPVIQDGPARGPNAAMMATLRPDLWKTHEQAASPLRKSKLFASWDPRVLDKYIQYSFRQTPTLLYPVDRSPPGSITLKTTKHQESWSYMRANFEPLGDAEFDQRLNPDLSRSFENEYVLFRPECSLAMKDVQHLLPPVLWIFGGKSIVSPPDWINWKVENTGIANGGSGGVKTGKVHHVVFPEGNHFVIFDQLQKVVIQMSSWLSTCALPDFEKDLAFWQNYDTKVSKNNMLEVSELWTETMKRPAGEKRPQRNKPKM